MSPLYVLTIETFGKIKWALMSEGALFLPGFEGWINRNTKKLQFHFFIILFKSHWTVMKRVNNEKRSLGL